MYTLTATAVVTRAETAWIAPADLIAEFNDIELASLADEYGRVSGQILKTATAGGDLSAESVETQQAASDAVARLQDECDDANARINMALLQAGLTNSLPNSLQRMLIASAEKIARYNLYKTGEIKNTDILYRRYKEALKLLEQIRAGGIYPGTQQQTAAPVDSPQISAPDPLFTRDKLLKDY